MPTQANHLHCVHRVLVAHTVHPGYAALAGAILLTLMPVPSAQAQNLPVGSRLAIGVLAHDRGPSSDYNESGIDPNIEIQFAPIERGIGRAIGSPRLHLGASINFDGDTSALYGGFTFELLSHRRLFVDGFLGLALHNGPLHKDELRCQVESDCGFGYRVIPRLGLEAGIRLSDHDAVSMFYDHMSHGELFNSENEGIDHVGFRYIRFH